MRSKYLLCSLLLICTVTSCGKTKAYGKDSISETDKKAVTTAVTQSVTTTTSLTKKAEATETTVTEAVTEASQEVTKAVQLETTVTTPEIIEEETAATESAEPEYEQFTGILIDEDCSDYDDPPEHDLPCMLMDSCRESGYGLDIQEEDGSWTFYMFDENGQDIALEYLLNTDRMDHLYVTITGTLTDNTINVIKLEEK